MTSSRLFRAASVTGAVACGILAVLTTSASAAGESPTATLTDAVVGVCDDGRPGEIELASQQYTLRPDGQSVTGKIGVTFSCPTAELPRTGSPG